MNSHHMRLFIWSGKTEEGVWESSTVKSPLDFMGVNNFVYITHLIIEVPIGN